MRTCKNIKKHNKKTFTKKQYNSKDGMLTKIWGPTMWHTLHTISFNYPMKPTYEQKIKYRNFILSLKHVLPCGKCRENLVNNLKQLPLTMNKMKSRYTFSRYIFKLHELINTMLNKVSNLSYEDVRDRYEHFRARCKDMPIVDSRKTEKGCTEPLKGAKTKCIMKIVPDEHSCETFEVNL